MATYVYVTATGVPYSYNPDDTSPVASAQVLAANGLTALRNQTALGPGQTWSISGGAVVIAAAPTPANVINTFDFVMAFTAAELAAIRASTDNNIQQFLFAMQVTQGVNLNSTTIANALSYLVSKSLLTSARETAILATVGGNAAAS